MTIPKNGRRQHVDLGVAEVPEQVLEQRHPAVGRVVDVRPEAAVGGQTEGGGGQQREDQDDQDR